MLRFDLGASQEPPSTSGQVSTCRRWCISRCNQGAPFTAPRGSHGCSFGSDQGGQREARGCTECQEDGEGEECSGCCQGTDYRTVSYRQRRKTYRGKAHADHSIVLLASRLREVRHQSRSQPPARHAFVIYHRNDTYAAEAALNVQLLDCVPLRCNRSSREASMQRPSHASISGRHLSTKITALHRFTRCN